jgi:uncharacterized protein
MTGRQAILAAAMLASAYAASPAPARAQVAQQGAFVIVIGTDTFAVENFTRTAARLDGELTGRAIGRVVYSATLGRAATIGTMTMQAWPAGMPADGSPMQEARLTLEADSAIFESSGAAGSATQRLATPPDALPFLNPSFLLTEQIVMRARAIGGASATVPLLLLQGGHTVNATVSWPAEDSAVVTLAGVEMRVHVGADGRMLGAAVPAQRLTVTRVDGAHVTPVAVEPPDYSAPDGAPYTALPVNITTPAGHTLAGTLTLPPGGERAPAVVTITGSGAQDRDQALPMLPGYRPFRQVADTLSRRGIAVLRLDDRGFGESTGSFAGSTSADFADDIRAAVAWLRRRPEIDGDRIALVGHSEGGLIAPLVAVTDTALAGIVLIAGPAHTGRRILEFQQRYAIEQTESIPAAARDSAFDAAQAQMEALAARQPWLAWFLEYDPLATARLVHRTPVLVLHGETDRQVTMEQAAGLADAFRASGNPDVTVRVLDGVNHLMLRDPDGNPATYGALEDRSVVPEVLGELADWLVARLR